MDLKLTNRYVLKAILSTNTGLHLGGGKENFATESPVIRDASGKPFIPGSSFKGVLRSTVEKILPVIAPYSGVWSCQLFSESDGAKKCLSSPVNQKKLSQLRDEAKLRTKVKDSRILSDEDKYTNPEDIITEQFILEKFLTKNLCDTCKVFGSPVLSSKFKIQDLHIREPYFERSEIRDGVGIDRDTETAVDQAKFDFEVIPSQTEFDVNITLENVSNRELAIFAIGIREFCEGNVSIGGLSSRGLGACKLEINTIEFVDFTNSNHLEKYLVEGKMFGILTTEELFQMIKTELLTKKGNSNDV